MEMYNYVIRTLKHVKTHREQPIQAYMGIYFLETSSVLLRLKLRKI